jgi:tetratricopeptide (TPR) repeat protein
MHFALGLVLAVSPKLPPVEVVMKDLQSIEVAGFRGKLDLKRVELKAELDKAPNSVLGKVKVAWCTLPSDDSWNQLKAISVMEPDNLWVRYGMGRTYLFWKMNDLALKEFEGMLKKDPQFYPALVGEAQVYAAQQNLEKAEATFRAAIALAPQDALAHSGLGLLLKQKGDKKNALTELESSVSKLPEMPLAQEALLQLQLESNDPKSVTTAATLSELKPRDRAIKRTLIDLYLKAQNPTAAAKEMERLIAIGGGDESTMTQLATIYRDAHDAVAEERIVALQSGAESQNVAAALRLAQLRSVKNDASSEAAWREVLVRDPKNVEALFQMGQIRKTAGVPHEALNYFRLAKAADETRADAATEVAALEKDFQLSAKKPSGSVSSVSFQVSKSLNALFVAQPVSQAANGKLRLRVRITAEGLADVVTVLEDGVKNKNLLGHVVFQLQDATYDKKKAEPVFEFELARNKGKKK